MLVSPLIRPSSAVPAAAIETAAVAAAASRSVAAFTPPGVSRTFEDRTESILSRLAELPGRRGPLALHFKAMVRDARAHERPFYAEASWHLDRLLQLDPWQDGENTYFEYLAYQIIEAVLKNKDLASFVYFLSVMGGGRGRPRSVAALEELALRENMQAYFGLVGPPAHRGFKTFGCGDAVETVEKSPAFRAVQKEILAFLGTVAAKMEGRARDAGLGSDAYCLSVGELVHAFGYGLEHPDLGSVAEEAILDAAAHPLAFLRLNRIAHVFMSRDMEHKAAEILPRRGADRFSDLCGEIEAAARRDPDEARKRRPDSGRFADWLAASPLREARLLGDSLERSVDVFEHDAASFRNLMKETYRQGAGEVDAHYRFPAGIGGRAEIHLVKGIPYSVACRAFHEGIHVGQARRHRSTEWVEQHVALAEREAYAIEVLFRLHFGDRGLYETIAALSPQGIEQGLTILVEQLFFRLRGLPV
jgi:hypothetical protein